MRIRADPDPKRMCRNICKPFYAWMKLSDFRPDLQCPARTDICYPVFWAVRYQINRISCKSLSGAFLLSKIFFLFCCVNKSLFEEKKSKDALYSILRITNTVIRDKLHVSSYFVCLNIKDVLQVRILDRRLYPRLSRLFPTNVDLKAGEIFIAHKWYRVCLHTATFKVRLNPPAEAHPPAEA